MKYDLKKTNGDVIRTEEFDEDPPELAEAKGMQWVPHVPVELPPVIPAVVTMRQARLALLQQDLLDQVNDAIAAIPGDEGKAASITWEFSSEVQRNHPLIASLKSALSLTDEQLDDLFLLAGGL